MKLEDQVPSRKTCERLKDAGFAQGVSYFDWIRIEDPPWSVWPHHEAVQEQAAGPDFVTLLAAPTLSEVLDALIADPTHSIALHFQLSSVGPLAFAFGFGINFEVRHKSAVEAAALLWLKLHEKEATT